MTPLCPECMQGKTGNCTGTALDTVTDELVACAGGVLNWHEPDVDVARISSRAVLTPPALEPGWLNRYAASDPVVNQRAKLEQRFAVADAMLADHVAHLVRVQASRVQLVEEYAALVALARCPWFLHRNIATVRSTRLELVR